MTETESVSTAAAMAVMSVQLAGHAAALVASASDAIVAADASGAITLWNEGAVKLFGHASADVLGRSLDIIIPEAMRGEHAAGMRRITAGGVPRLIGKPVEIWALRADGSTFPIEMRLSMWSTPEPGFGAIIRDVSERRKTEDRLHSLAHFDQLSMLPNRDLFLQRLGALCAVGHAPLEAAVLVMDIDSFAEVNDVLGHAAGDALIRRIAVGLKRFSQQADALDATIARIGPNQFGLVLQGVADPLAALGVAEGLRQTVKDAGAENDISITASVGVALAPVHGETPGKLLANADFALRRAKLERGDRSELFRPQRREAYRLRRGLEVELKRAWSEGEFEVFFQPQVRLSDRVVAGAEALLRWRHPERGLLLPGMFLHVLKDGRLAEEVGDFVLGAACRRAAEWGRRLGRPLRIGVNLFERQLLQRDQPQRIAAALGASGLAPENLEIEITETVMTGSDDASIRRVRRLRDLGVGIAFDDYGTGYASLGLLKRYPITRLKIDRSFVRDVMNDRQDAAIVDLVLTLGRRFGFGVIAEGIETPEQASWLSGMGCAEGQGYLFGKPMPAAAFEDSLSMGREPVPASSMVA